MLTSHPWTRRYPPACKKGWPGPTGTPDRIQVTWSPRRCTHAGECFRTPLEVFDPVARPWVRPEAADPDVVEATVLRCPSGALGFRRLDADQADLRGLRRPRMEFGAHLPLMTWGDEDSPSLAGLSEYARRARELGFTWLTANDHLVYAKPWLDGPAALASVLSETGDMTVGTTIALPVVRGPGPLAKALAAIDRLSGGRLVVGLGPGSSERDYRAVGLAWEERWPRFEEAVQALRALFRPDGDGFEGAFYSTEGMTLFPAPLQPGGPPIWLGSWGSDAGLRRVARLADGWLARRTTRRPTGSAKRTGAWGITCARPGSIPPGSRTRSQLRGSM